MNLLIWDDSTIQNQMISENTGREEKNPGKIKYKTRIQQLQIIRHSGRMEDYLKHELIFYLQRCQLTCRTFSEFSIFNCNNILFHLYCVLELYCAKVKMHLWNTFKSPQSYSWKIWLRRLKSNIFHSGNFTFAQYNSMTQYKWNLGTKWANVSFPRRTGGLANCILSIARPTPQE